MYRCRSVRLQRWGQRKKSGHPWHFRCWSPRRNELECINLLHWREALYGFSSRDAIIIFGFVLEKHFEGDFTPDQEKEITFKRWPSGDQSWKLSLALNRLNIPKILNHTTYKLVGFVDITSEDLPLLFLLGHDVSKETLVRLVVASVRNVVQPMLVENSLLPEKRTKIVFNMMPQQTYFVHISSTWLPCLALVFIRLCRLCLDVNAKLLQESVDLWADASSKS